MARRRSLLGPRLGLRPPAADLARAAPAARRTRGTAAPAGRARACPARVGPGVRRQRLPGVEWAHRTRDRHPEESAPAMITQSSLRNHGYGHSPPDIANPAARRDRRPYRFGTAPI